MRQFAISTALLCGCFFSLAMTGPVQALVVAAPTGPVKAAQSDLIVLGKVIKLEEGAEATPAPGAKNKVPYSLAVIQVTEVIRGEAKDKLVRVGTPLSGAIKPGPGPILKLAVGQEGLFFLKKHHSAEFHVLPMAGTFVSNQAKIPFDRELEETRQTLVVLANPLNGLKTAEEAKRLEIISILMTVYNTAPLNASFKQEPIDAEQSKLILKSLLDADWDYNKYKGANYKQNPAMLFNLLGLTAKEGFQNPNKGLFSMEYATAGKNWLTKNWQTYRLQRVVVTPSMMDAEK